MKNFEKMNEVVSKNWTADQWKEWAYANRITVSIMDLEDEFTLFENDVVEFMDSDLYSESNEHLNWETFLEFEFKG